MLGIEELRNHILFKMISQKPNEVWSFNLKLVEHNLKFKIIFWFL